MLNEYALEPSLLSNWSDFRFLISQFGFDQGRLIACFPKKWKRMVYESLSNCAPIERKKIEEALTRIDSRMIPRSRTNYLTRDDWLKNAEVEHCKHPFRAIIAKSNIQSHPDIIIASSLDDTLEFDALLEDDPRRLWKATRSKIIKRDAKEMADTIDVFMKHAKTIIFVDKHFGPENPRHRITFEEFFSRLTKRDMNSMPESISVHCASKSEKTFFKSKCEDFSVMLPVNVKLKFHRWHADDLHNRFVLTELGGVAFLEGLDQHMGNGRDEDVVALLDKDVSQQLLKNYIPTESRFRHIDQFEIIGKCKAK